MRPDARGDRPRPGSVRPTRWRSRPSLAEQLPWRRYRRRGRPPPSRHWPDEPLDQVDDVLAADAAARAASPFCSSPTGSVSRCHDAHRQGAGPVQRQHRPGAPHRRSRRAGPPGSAIPAVRSCACWLALVVITAIFVGFGLGDLLLFIVILVVIVMLHEAAHFVTAKLAGMKVTEFFVGFGPRLWSVRRGETEYGVKATPARRLRAHHGLHRPRRGGSRRTRPAPTARRRSGSGSSWRSAGSPCTSSSHWCWPLIVVFWSGVTGELTRR